MSACLRAGLWKTRDRDDTCALWAPRKMTNALQSLWWWSAMSGTHGSVWMFFWLKTNPRGLGRGKRSVPNVSFFLFLFRAENGTTWDVTRANKLFGSDPTAGLMGQNIAGSCSWSLGLKNKSDLSRGLQGQAWGCLTLVQRTLLKATIVQTKPPEAH